MNRVLPRRVNRGMSWWGPSYIPVIRVKYDDDPDASPTFDSTTLTFDSVTLTFDDEG